MMQVWQVPQTGPKHLHFKALLRGPQAQPSLRAEAKGPVNPETLLRYDLPPAGPCTAALDPALLSSDADTEAGWGLELAVWPRGPRSPPSLAPASGHRKPEAPSTASFLFSLGAKRQFRRCSGVLSRSKGFRGGGKFCLLQGLKSSRAGLATALRTPIKPRVPARPPLPAQVLHLAPDLSCRSSVFIGRSRAQGLEAAGQRVPALPRVNCEPGARDAKPPRFRIPETRDCSLHSGQFGNEVVHPSAQPGTADGRSSGCEGSRS